MDAVQSAVLRAAAFAVLAAGAFACVWLVFVAKVGPVVVTLSTTHGVHAGDLLAFPIAAAAVAVAAILIKIADYRPN